MDFPDHCQRCRKKGCALIMSKFDTAMICMDCKQKETEHPDYAAADAAEVESVRRGETNFPGVGKPSDL